MAVTTLTAAAPSAPSAPSAPEQGRTIRRDIEGLRAVAVGVVLLAHAGVDAAAGGYVGVDVFFVLSGFLITGLLAREVSRTGRVDLVGFWARRMKRLLPASATVLAFSAVVTYLFLPVTQHRTFGADIGSAALSVVNWRLADRGVDYLAEDVGGSPVQHYWSLAVEEQFYLVWPVLVLLVAVVAGARWRRLVSVVLAAVTVTSFTYSVLATADAPAAAYFASTTRAWELGLGALLALGADRAARVPAGLRAAGGWAGLLLIGSAVLLFDASTTWPGANALLPTVGAVLVIAGGLSDTPGSPQRLLGTAPMVWVGGLSYAIYLWHWPLLVAAQALRPDMRTGYVLVLMVLSVVPAYLSTRLVEDPVRFGTRFRPTAAALRLGLALTAAGLVAGLALIVSAVLAPGIEEASETEAVGASALLDPAQRDVVWSQVREVDSMRPLPEAAVEDLPPFYTDGSGCQVADGDPVPRLCEWGDTGSQRTVVMVGDSKMAQWHTPLEDIAAEDGWRLVQITKSSCPFTDAVTDADNAADCHAWGRAALEHVLALEPDLVITSHRQREALPDDPGSSPTQDAMAAGMQRYWTAITDAGIPVVALLDNPSPATAPVYECVAANPEDLTRCSFDRSDGLAGSGAPAAVQAAAMVPEVEVVDMSGTICPDGDRCAAVIGDVLVYRQGTHLTMSFLDSAEPQLAAALHEATDGALGEPLG